jgi:SET domain
MLFGMPGGHWVTGFIEKIARGIRACVVIHQLLSNTNNRSLTEEDNLWWFMPAADVLGFSAALLQVAGYLLYIRQFRRSSIRPNAASWLMFAYGTTLLVLLEAVNGATWSVMALPAVCAAMSVGVAYLCFKPGATDPVEPSEKLVFGADVLLSIAFVLMVTGIAFQEAPKPVFLILGNITTFTAFLPILISTWKAPEREHPAAWTVWSIAYLLLFVATLWVDRGANPSLLIYPTLSVLLHASIAAMAFWGRADRRKFVGADREIYLAQSAISGRGMFATRAYAAGDVICRLEGSVKKGPVTSDTGPNWIGIGPNLWIDPKSPLDFINHSCEPNAAFGRKRQLVALAPIAAEDEITFDYSTSETDPDWTMDCSCGTPSCRRGLFAIQHSFVGAVDAPPASPLMQLIWKKRRHVPETATAFPQLGDNVTVLPVKRRRRRAEVPAQREAVG